MQRVKMATYGLGHVRACPDPEGEFVRADEAMAEICRLKGTVETIRLLVSSTDDDEIVRMKIIEMITE
jgi:hypothetical protein